MIAEVGPISCARRRIMSANPEPSERAVAILYVERNRMLWETVRDVLEYAGWYVRRFDRGYAFAYVESREHFDLLIINHDPRESSEGIALVRRARRLPHRQKTPIIVTSLEDCEREALEAGADAFLRKPNNLIELVDTIRRLLAARGEEAA